jgi:hypothetical protein
VIRRLIPAGALLALLAMAVLMKPAAVPQEPTACRGVGQAPEPLPSALLGAFIRAFHLPSPEAARGAVVRCADGVLMGCGIGANLPCGPADTRRIIPATDAWCEQNPGAAFIPAYVTGHATLYAWRCDGQQAAIARQVAHADAAGYVTEYWRKLSP